MPTTFQLGLPKKEGKEERVISVGNNWINDNGKLFSLVNKY